MKTYNPTGFLDSGTFRLNHSVGCSNPDGSCSCGGQCGCGGTHGSEGHGPTVADCNGELVAGARGRASRGGSCTGGCSCKGGHRGSGGCGKSRSVGCEGQKGEWAQAQGSVESEVGGQIVDLGNARVESLWSTATIQTESGAPCDIRCVDKFSEIGRRCGSVSTIDPRNEAACDQARDAYDKCCEAPPLPQEQVVDKCCCPVAMRIRFASTADPDNSHPRLETEHVFEGETFHGLAIYYDLEYGFREGPGGYCTVKWWEASRRGGKGVLNYDGTFRANRWNSVNDQVKSFVEETAKLAGDQARGETGSRLSDTPGRIWIGGKFTSGETLIQFLRLDPGCVECQPCCLFVMVNEKVWPFQVYLRAKCGGSCGRQPGLVLDENGNIDYWLTFGSDWGDNGYGEMRWLGPFLSNAYTWTGTDGRVLEFKPWEGDVWR